MLGAIDFQYALTYFVPLTIIAILNGAFIHRLILSLTTLVLSIVWFAVCWGLVFISAMFWNMGGGETHPNWWGILALWSFAGWAILWLPVIIRWHFIRARLSRRHPRTHPGRPGGFPVVTKDEDLT
jgi:hypothetical protein